MAYLLSQPVATDRLSVSQPKLAGNTNQLNTSFGVDHYPYNDGTSNNGKHKVIKTPAQLADPTTGDDEPAIYAKSVFSTTPYVLQFSKLGPHVPPNSGDNSIAPLSTITNSGTVVNTASKTIINVNGASGGTMVRIGIVVSGVGLYNFNEFVFSFNGTSFPTQSSPAPSNAVFPAFICGASLLTGVYLFPSGKSITIVNTIGVDIEYIATVSFIRIL